MVPSLKYTVPAMPLEQTMATFLPFLCKSFCRARTKVDFPVPAWPVTRILWPALATLTISDCSVVNVLESLNGKEEGVGGAST